MIGKEMLCKENFFKNGFKNFIGGDLYLIVPLGINQDGYNRYEIFHGRERITGIVLQPFIDKYFLTPAQYRERQIDSILNEE